MGNIGVVTDSHSGITKEQAAHEGVMVLPAPFFIGDDCFREGVDLTREEFFEKLRTGIKVTTSQPSPEELTGFWDEALEKYDQIIYIPISSGLSGSCMTAIMLAQDEAYEDRVFVVDNGRVSTPLHRSVLDAVELVNEGLSAAEIKLRLEQARDNMVIYIGFDSLDRLKAGGRINPSAALLGNLFGIKPILKFTTGLLDPFAKCRGMVKCRREMIAAMKNDLNTTFSEWYKKGEVHLVAASSASPEVTESWVKEIQEAFPDMDVMCDDLALAISCHIGEGGLGIGCSCKP